MRGQWDEGNIAFVGRRYSLECNTPMPPRSSSLTEHICTYITYNMYIHGTYIQSGARVPRSIQHRKSSHVACSADGSSSTRESNSRFLYSELQSTRFSPLLPLPSLQHRERSTLEFLISNDI